MPKVELQQTGQWAWGRGVETIKTVGKWKSSHWWLCNETTWFWTTFLWLMFFVEKNSVVRGKVLMFWIFTGFCFGLRAYFAKSVKYCEVIDSVTEMNMTWHIIKITTYFNRIILKQQNPRWLIFILVVPIVGFKTSLWFSQGFCVCCSSNVTCFQWLRAFHN